MPIDAEYDELILATHALQSYWKLDETGGSTANDSGPANKDGTYTSVTLNSSTIHGRACPDFSGVGSQVALPTLTVPTSQQYSWEAWCLADTIGDNCLISEHYISGSNRCAMQIGCGTTTSTPSVWAAGWYSGSAWFNAASAIGATATLYHVAASRYGNTITIFVNGIARANVDAGAYEWQDDGWFIGRGHTTANGFRWDGRISSVAFYHTAHPASVWAEHVAQATYVQPEWSTSRAKRTY